MTDKFACEFDLDIYYEDDGQKEYSHDLRGFASSLPDVKDFLYDFFSYLADEEQMKSLDIGDYHVFVFGTVEFYSDRDWETGWEEGGFVFEWEDVQIFKYPEEKL